MQLAGLRSLLFIPATSATFLEKAHERGADAVIVDLEDAIHPARKDEARALAGPAVQSLAARGLTVLLRVNAERSQWLADLDAAPLRALAGLMLPKVESAAQVHAFAEAVAERERALGIAEPRQIAALVESPLGVLRAAEIAEANAPLAALGFGAEDYCAHMGLPPGPDALRWPAQQLVVAARAHGLACWGLADSIAEVADLGRLKKSIAEARALGFTGSVAIHPKQVPLFNEGFSPSAEERAWARRVTEAAAAASAAGLGAVLLDGRMIDKPVVERAFRVLAQR